MKIPCFPRPTLMWTVLIGMAFWPVSGSLSAQPMELSLGRAVELALSEQGNARGLLAEEQVRTAEAVASQSRAALLPHLDGYAGIQAQTRNLEAFGLRPVEIPGVPSPISRFVGPFTTVDLRANLQQNVFDLRAIRRFQAAKSGLETAQAWNQYEKEAVAAETARAYYTALWLRESMQTAQSSVELARALLEMADNLKQAGTGTGIEVTRARVQLAHEEQQLFSAEDQCQRALVGLRRVVGLPLGTPVELTDTLRSPLELLPVEEGIAKALGQGSELAAQRKRENSARLELDAARSRRVPSLVGFGDYGTIGTTDGSKLPTWTAGLSLRIPIFDGGTLEAEKAEAITRLRQEEIRTRDLQIRLELEVRNAYRSLRVIAEEIRVAEYGLELANEELAQARRRYQAGIATNLEVTDAQNRLRRAEENRTTAAYRYSLAWIDLLLATGQIRDTLLP